MENNFLTLEGEAIAVTALRVQRAQALWEYIVAGANPHVRPIELRKLGDLETVVFEVFPDIHQRTTFDIRFCERIAAQFHQRDDTLPEVVSLRKDFPRVPHLNYRTFDLPRSLCLYDQTWPELKRSWSPARFIERVREWLSKTAHATLHEADQELEPLLPISIPRIILPLKFFDASGGALPLLSISYLEQGGTSTLIAEPIDKLEDFRPDPKYPPSLGYILNCPPAVHGVIQRQPQTFADLCSILKETSHDLLGELRGLLQGWAKEQKLKNPLLQYRLVILITVPHVRTEGATPEIQKAWVFGFHESILQIGEKLGVWERVKSSEFPGLLLKIDETRNGGDIRVSTFNPVSELTRTIAAKQNGADKPDDRQFAIVGLGALGSYVSLNFAKSAFGRWVMIDADVLLPHNYARHAAPAGYSGHSKARIMSLAAQSHYPSEEAFEAIQADMLALPLDAKVEIEKSLSSAQAIIDCSASIPVARELTHSFSTCRARRVSAFLNPSGSDLVVLAESEDRQQRLDVLEMQYLRALCTVPSLQNHLQGVARLRYARTCADVSSTIPNELVMGSSAIASTHLKRSLGNTAASIDVWHTNPVTLEVARTSVRSSAAQFVSCGSWTVITDSDFLEALQRERHRKLPNETGGTLVGQIDLEQKIVYVFYSLSAPADSRESPGGFVRGAAGNLDALKGVQQKTAFGFTYVGEWHSHPPSAGVRPSADDDKLLKRVAVDMHPEGLPALMIIVGDNQTANFILSTPSGERCESVETR